MEKQFSMFATSKRSSSKMIKTKVAPRGSNVPLSRSAFPSQTQHQPEPLGRNFTRRGRGLPRGFEPKKRGCRSCGGAR